VKEIILHVSENESRISFIRSTWFIPLVLTRREREREREKGRDIERGERE
jgi:hypothetical protein